MNTIARRNPSDKNTTFRFPIGNRQARRRRCTVPSSRGISAFCEPLENRALLSSAWLSYGVPDMQVGHFPSTEVRQDYAAGQASQVQLHMPASAVGSFLSSDVARIDAVNASGTNPAIVLSSNEPVAAEIARPDDNDIVIEGAGNDTVNASSGRDRLRGQSGDAVSYGGSGFIMIH